jgi:hypothetical protein
LCVIDWLVMDNSINYKGLLQEYYQKEKLDLPVYSYVSSNSFPITWVAQLHTLRGNYTSASYASKREADQSVSYMAYMSLLTKIQLTPKFQNLSTKFLTLVVVDLENYPQIDTPQFLTTKFTNVQFSGFVGKTSSQAQMSQVDLERKYPFMGISIVNSLYPDAVDHFISMYVGHYIAKTADCYTNANCNIIILTRDRFVGSTMDAARQFCTNYSPIQIEFHLNLNIVHAVTAQQCYDYLIEFSK